MSPIIFYKYSVKCCKDAIIALSLQLRAFLFMMSVDDVTEILSVPLIGILPDDEQVVIGTNQGEPVIGLDSTAGKGYLNICKRILGLEVPYINLDTGKGFFSRISHAFKKN